MNRGEYINSFAIPATYDDMRAFRGPIATTHLYAYYLLTSTIVLHIVNVVITERREKSGRVLATLIGEKVLSTSVVDNT